jgi:predicted RND superfamily exporter protein
MNTFIRFLLKQAGWVVALCGVLGVIGGYYSIHLFSNLRTDLEELLPVQARSVQDLNEVRSRLLTTNNLAVLVLSSDIRASKRFVDDLARELEKLPETTIAGVEYRIDKELAFFQGRRSLFIDKSDLMSIRNFIEERIDYELTLYNPLTIVENKNIREPTLDFKKLKGKYESKTSGYSRFPGGYYASTDETKRVLLANLPANASGITASKHLREATDAVIARLGPKSYAPDLDIHFGGGVQDLIDEHEALIEDLLLSTVLVCILVSVAMLLYFKTFLGTLSLLLGLFIGTFWTFGVGFFQVGYLNANSAFMASIVIGNGINFGIILLARFLEERRKRKETPRALYIAVQKTLSATGVAALAAGLAYGSLMLTSFRGFRQFGVIGLTGMALCWLASYVFMPSFMILIYRLGGFRKPVKKSDPVFTLWLTRLIQRSPKAILGITAVLTLASALSLLRIGPGMIETDMKKLRNKHSAVNGSIYWSAVVDEIFQKYLLPVVILPKNKDDVKKIAEEVRKTKAAEGDRSFIVNVSTLDDFIAEEQSEKIKILRQIDQLLPRQLIEKLTPEEKQMTRELLSPRSFQTFGIADLPPLIRNKFKERDGTIGKIVMIEPSLSPELTKSENLIHFVHSVREAADRIAPGTAVAGTLPVTSDLFESIVKDGPTATLFAFMAVFLLIVLLFRDIPTIAQCSFALILGVLLLFGYILICQEKINFLNFIALPITFGIGVDYGVNIFQRYRLEKQKGILPVLKHTGGAVMLASFTTVTGYGSLLIASNQAFVSFGKLAVLGEFTCVFAAVVALPALISILEKRAVTRS